MKRTDDRSDQSAGDSVVSWEKEIFLKEALAAHAAITPLTQVQQRFPAKGGEKYNSIIVDAEKHKVVDILPNRFENDLIKYFSQFPSKTGVKYFVCDMNPHFRAVSKTCFPGAAIVADRYHVIRQVYWAMERVRKKEQKKPSARFRKYFKRSRCLLMKPMAKL